MIESIVDWKISNLKPNMETIEYIQDLKLFPANSVIMVKADGEFTLLRYDRDADSYTLNQWGRLRMDFPALNELVEAMKQAGVKKAELLVELYAKTVDGKPLRLPDYIHMVKSGDPALLQQIHIGVWDVLSVDDVPSTVAYSVKMNSAQAWLKNCKLAQVLPYALATDTFQVERFWKLYVEEVGWEGIVFRTGDETIKVKPFKDVDCAVLGVNKVTSYGKQNRFKFSEATSLHLGLMDKDGNFVEIGDVASGIDHALRTELWKVANAYKVAEDDKILWIKPFIVITVEYTDLFVQKDKATSNILKFTPNGYVKVGEMKFVRLRFPRLPKPPKKTFRADKTVNPNDLRLEQIPTEYLEQLTAT